MAQVQVELFPALSSSAGGTGKGVDFIFFKLFLHLPHFILMRDGNIIISSFNQLGGCSPIAMGECGRGGRSEGEGGKRRGGGGGGRGKGKGRKKGRGIEGGGGGSMIRSIGIIYHILFVSLYLH